jgi:RNA-directed DNA polymerase
VVAILTPIYESEFLGFSYGFRPKRNQHQALDALAFGIGKRRINWVLDCDVQSFFDKVRPGSPSAPAITARPAAGRAREAAT